MQEPTHEDQIDALANHAFNVAKRLQRLHAIVLNCSDDGGPPDGPVTHNSIGNAGDGKINGSIGYSADPVEAAAQHLTDLYRSDRRNFHYQHSEVDHYFWSPGGAVAIRPLSHATPSTTAALIDLKANLYADLHEMIDPELTPIEVDYRGDRIQILLWKSHGKAHWLRVGDAWPAFRSLILDLYPDRLELSKLEVDARTEAQNAMQMLQQEISQLTPNGDAQLLQYHRSADSHDDTKKKTLPRSPDVIALCKKLQANARKGKSEAQIAREYVGRNDRAGLKKAANLLRSARRHRHLWE